MEFTIQQIAEVLGGQVIGDAETKIHTAATIEEGKKGAISFLANLKYEDFLYTTQSSVVLINKDFTPKTKVNTNLIVVDDAYVAFSTLLEMYNKVRNPEKFGIEQPSFISDSTTLGEDIYVGAFAYIGKNVTIAKGVKIYPQVYIGDNCIIGENTLIYAGAKVHHDTEIGKNCTLHAGSVIGADGFGFAPEADGTYKTIPQLGNVCLKDNVSIGANATVDRATTGTTLLAEGVKIDNFVQIAHNVKIGKNTVIAAHAGISGSTEVGENCVIAGQVGMVGHIKIANKTTIGAQAGIVRAVKEEGTVLLGSPAIDISNARKSFVVFKKLPELQKQVRQLEKALEALKKES